MRFRSLRESSFTPEHVLAALCAKTPGAKALQLTNMVHVLTKRVLPDLKKPPVPGVLMQMNLAVTIESPISLIGAGFSQQRASSVKQTFFSDRFYLKTKLATAEVIVFRFRHYIASLYLIQAIDFSFGTRFVQKAET